jgi:hypothetical protein
MVSIRDGGVGLPGTAKSSRLLLILYDLSIARIMFAENLGTAESLICLASYNMEKDGSLML